MTCNADQKSPLEKLRGSVLKYERPCDSVIEYILEELIGPEDKAPDKYSRTAEVDEWLNTLPVGEEH